MTIEFSLETKAGVGFVQRHYRLVAEGGIVILEGYENTIDETIRRLFAQAAAKCAKAIESRG
jgi:hypothetical protein